MRKKTIQSLAALSLAVLFGVGCFNDAFRGHEFSGEEGTDRFELVIEPDRTLVDGTHFLVDRATGDLWRLDTADRRNGEWVRLAGGPDDAAELEIVLDVKKAQEED